MQVSVKSAAAVAAALAIGFGCGRLSVAPEVRGGSVKVLTRIDTVRVEQPVAVRTEALPTVVERLVEHHTRDTVYVEVPLARTVYEGPDYRATVSGYRASLDSITVYRRHTTLSRSSVAPRFSVGVQAGYGYTPKGFQPYIGIGLSVRIISF